MIYFFHGTHTDKARTKAHELVASLQKKKPDASFFKIDSETFNTPQLEEYIGGMGLFSNKYIVFLDRLSEKKNVKDELIDKLKEIGESENIFIILEGKLDKATLTKIEKKAEKTLHFELLEEAPKPTYNAFALADAFARGNKKEAWMLYRKSIDMGEAPEALHGMIFWKAKTLALAGQDMGKTLEDLVVLYHDARRGKHDLETGLEAFLLA
jgi:DNA polymerase III delta subunit